MQEIERFYANYDSIRYVGDEPRHPAPRGPTDAQLAELNERFGHLVADGRRSGASSRSRSSGARTTTSTSPGSRSKFAKHGYGDCGR